MGRMWNFWVCFNSVLQHLLRCQHQPVSLGTIGGRAPGPQPGPRDNAEQRGQGGRAQQQLCSMLGPEQHNTQSFCRQLVRPELLVPWKWAPEWNGSYTIRTHCQPLKTAMAPSKSLARKPSWKQALSYLWQAEPNGFNFLDCSGGQSDWQHQQNVSRIPNSCYHKLIRTVLGRDAQYWWTWLFYAWLRI